MRQLIAAVLLAVPCAACGGPSGSGQDAQTSDEWLAEQEKLGAEQQAASDDSLDSFDAAETDAEKRKKFDQRQAELELKRAARSAKTCSGVVDEEGPSGEAVVSLTFSNDGHVKESSISSEFNDTKIGKCILRAMEAVIVPAYNGDEVSVDWKIDMTPEEPAEGEKEEPKKKK